MANTTLTQFPAGQTQYKINFDYLARHFVVVTLVNSNDAAQNRVLTVGNDYGFLNPTTIEIYTSQSGFDIVQIHRFTSTELLVEFSDGSVLTSADLTNAELQAIHIAEEGRDQTVDLAKQYAEEAGYSLSTIRTLYNEIVRVVYPFSITEYLTIGNIVPDGTTHVRLYDGLYSLKPLASGVVTAIGEHYAIIGGETVEISKILNETSNKLSDWVNRNEDATDTIVKMHSLYDEVIVDIDCVISSNIRFTKKGFRLIGNGSRVGLNALTMNKSIGAMEFVADYQECSGIEFYPVAGTGEITPVRAGNMEYGPTSSVLVKGFRSNKLHFNGTGAKGPNLGNLVLIGCSYPEVTSPRFTGSITAGGNMEVLGVNGGYCSHGYAENGLLINFHATSASEYGYPTKNFQFIECEGVMSSAALGNVSGAVGGNNNIKFSRGCDNCKVVGGKFTSIANGQFTGNDHVFASQGCSNIQVHGAVIYMQGNGSFKSAFGVSDHNTALTESNDVIIRDCVVTINTPGTYNRVLQIQSTAGKAVRRTSLINVRLNSYNGPNTVDAICEQAVSNGGLIADTTVKGCTGIGVALVLRNRGGLSSGLITYLDKNRAGTVYDSRLLDSGSVVIVNPTVYMFSTLDNGAIGSSTGFTATKQSPGAYTLTFPTPVNAQNHTFSSPGTGRYCTVEQVTPQQIKVTTYSATGVADMRVSMSFW